MQSSPKGHMSTLKGAFHPETVTDLLDKSEQRRVELLGWSDRVDRKLLAVLTADGVNVAFLVSIRDSIPTPVVIVVGMLVFTSLVLAYLAWRPLGYRAIATDRFADNLDIHPDDRHQRFLIAAHNLANRQIHDLIDWKAKKLAVATGCLAIGALLTIGYAVLGSTLCPTQ